MDPINYHHTSTSAPSDFLTTGQCQMLPVCFIIVGWGLCQWKGIIAPTVTFQEQRVLVGHHQKKSIFLFYLQRQRSQDHESECAGQGVRWHLRKDKNLSEDVISSFRCNRLGIIIIFFLLSVGNNEEEDFWPFFDDLFESYSSFVLGLSRSVEECNSAICNSGGLICRLHHNKAIHCVRAEQEGEEEEENTSNFQVQVW